MINPISRSHFKLQSLFDSPYCQKLSQMTVIALGIIGRLALSLSINLALRYTFAAFLVPISQLVLVISCVALMILISTEIVKRIKKLPSFYLIEAIARPIFINTATLKLNCLIHEMGHACAASLLFVKANPEITATFTTGRTAYAVSYGLTALGKVLSRSSALLAITAAGLLTPSLCCIAEFAFAERLITYHPQLSAFLIDHGLSQLAQTLLYGMTTFFASNSDLQHDFINLWQLGGLHPMILLLLIVGLPLMQLFLLNYRRQARDSATKLV